MYSGNMRNATVTAKIFIERDFSLMAEDKLIMENITLQKAEAQWDCSSQCLAWKLKSRLCQQATGTTRFIQQK